MNQEEFEQLIDKYQRGLLNGKERDLMDKWFDQLDERGKGSVSWGVEEQERLKALILSEMLHDESESEAGRQALSLRSRVLRIAAIFLLAAISYGLWNIAIREFSSSRTVTVNSNETIRKVLLSDGSIVWLKPKSKLLYAQAFPNDSRQVTLEGEALFEVAKDPARPFVISASRLRATVLGTSFNIKSRAEDIEVVVLTGQVRLTSAEDSHGILLVANEKGVYRESEGSLSKLTLQDEEKRGVEFGTGYNMRFEGAMLKDVVSKMSSKFDLRIELDQPAVGACRITADLTDQSLEKSLSLISLALELEYQIEKGRARLIGNGCLGN
ncbi:MAG: FecR family protein [Cyclobacteriaceae bacterium]